jgi:hypothetical protein
MFTKSVAELQQGWEAYRSGSKTAKNHPIHKLIIYDFRGIIENWLPNKNNYLVRGSDGQGNILRTPWIAIMDKEVTTSATEGYYLVYLFNENLTKMYLEIGFGAYQFEKKFGRGKRYFDALEAAVKDMQDSSVYLLAKIEPAIRIRIHDKKPILDTQGDFHLRSYEKCSIYCVEYELNNLPDDQDLEKDFLGMLKLYELMTGSLLLADVEDYVIDEVAVPSVEEDFKPLDFQPRILKKRNTSSIVQSHTGRRYSKKSDKVGKLGEEFVFNYERRLLEKAGFSDLAKKVIWHRNDKVNKTPGWDITSFQFDGAPKFIEVKASMGNTITNVILTKNELEKLQDGNLAENYFLYLISNLVKNPKMEIVKNPAKYIKEGQLLLSVESYSLLLGKAD